MEQNGSQKSSQFILDNVVLRTLYGGQLSVVSTLISGSVQQKIQRCFMKSNFHFKFHIT